MVRFYFINWYFLYNVSSAVVHVLLLFLRITVTKAGEITYRAANNGRSTDNVRPDRGLDRSNSGLAGHFDRSFLDTNTSFSIQLSLNAL